MGLCLACLGVSLCAVFTFYLYTRYLHRSVNVGRETTFLERAVHSVDSNFSSYSVHLIFVMPHFGFDDSIFVLIVLVPGHCLPFTFY